MMESFPNQLRRDRLSSCISRVENAAKAMPPLLGKMELVTVLVEIDTQLK